MERRQAPALSEALQRIKKTRMDVRNELYDIMTKYPDYEIIGSTVDGVHRSWLTDVKVNHSDKRIELVIGYEW